MIRIRTNLPVPCKRVYPRLSIMTLSKTIPALLLALFLNLPAFGDDHGEEEDQHLNRRTNSEISGFLEQHVPEFLDRLAEASHEEDEEAEQEFWHDARHLVGEYFLIREDLGPGAAKAFVGMRRWELVADQLTEALHDGDGNREELEKELREAIAQHLEFHLELERITLKHDRAELEDLVQEIEERERELEELATHHQEIVREELAERVGEGEEDLEDEDSDEEDSE